MTQSHYYLVRVDQNTESNDSLEIQERLDGMLFGSPRVRVSLFATPDEWENQSPNDLIGNALDEMDT